MFACDTFDFYLAEVESLLVQDQISNIVVVNYQVVLYFFKY